MADFYCYVQNGVIERYNIAKPKAHGNTAFGANVTDEELVALGYFPIVGEPPAYDSATEHLNGPIYTVGDGVVARSYTVVNYEPLVPSSVPMWKARTVLIDAGLLDAVDAFINSIPDTTERKKASAKWDFSSTVRRDDPLLTVLASSLGLTSAQIDTLFITAESL